MSIISAFQPSGNTITITAANVAPTALQAVVYGPFTEQYRVVNTGNVTVYMGYGANAALANINGGSIAFTSGNSAALPVLAGSVEVFTLPANLYFTAQTVTSTAQVYVTPGEGL